MRINVIWLVEIGAAFLAVFLSGEMNPGLLMSIDIILQLGLAPMEKATGFLP